MKLQDRLLIKDEIPIWKTHFQIPIPARLLDEDARLDPELANKVFPQATEEWLSDSKEQAKPEFIATYLSTCSDTVRTIANGFASSLSVHQGDNGTIFLKPDHPHYLIPETVRMSKEKLKEFAIKEPPYLVHTYTSWNVHNCHPLTALFLRNWGMLYINEAMKQVL